MNSWQQTNWFVVHSKPCRESLAADNVGALGPEVFLPQLREERLIRRCRRTVTKPLFAGYLFARFRPCEALEAVRYAQGVLAVLSTGRIPIPVDDEIVAGVRARCARGWVCATRNSRASTGRLRRDPRGPFSGLGRPGRVRVRRRPASRSSARSRPQRASARRKALARRGRRIEQEKSLVFSRGRSCTGRAEPTQIQISRKISRRSGTLELHGPTRRKINNYQEY